MVGATNARNTGRSGSVGVLSRHELCFLLTTYVLVAQTSSSKTHADVHNVTQSSRVHVISESMPPEKGPWTVWTVVAKSNAWV
jgi:hypothetical protein